MKISAIFTDYDGTLAPEDVPPEASSVPKEVEAALLALSSSVPIAIVTSKDFAFIRRRTPFARAWACVSGLELVFDDGRAIATAQVHGRLDEGLRYVRRHDKFGLRLELKRSVGGALLGFSADWRVASAPPPDFIRAAALEMARLDLTVVHDPTRPFMDVFGATPDKGRAVRELKRLFSVTGNVLYIGDSVADNPAFEEADVTICVAHGQGLEELKCGYSLGQEELGGFFRSLSDGGFNLDLRSLKRK